MIVHYIGKLPPFMQSLEVSTAPFLIENIEHIRYLMIIEPFEIETEQFSIGTIWIQFLKKNYPNIILIVAGFEQTISTNFLDLLNPPENIKKWIQTKCEVLENVEIQPSHLSTLMDRLILFFKGHGDFSLFYTLNGLQHGISNIKDASDRIIKKTYEQAIISQLPICEEQWRLTHTRWLNYLPYFEPTPFTETIQSVTILIEAVDIFFKNASPTESTFRRADIHTNLENIRIHLRRIDKYVRTEQYQ